ncbi:ABC transporter sugar-binding protein [Halalkalibacter akibai JCM 9157]|uniref:ABC transporter sugar-binding protein n=2 Tax=Halalkalibacter akibai TaxID=1411 RepID=W4QXE5_HALA3|nr:ABC transporter sugar-binding protein [Halalkalibacter akibai JCM 9157]
MAIISVSFILSIHFFLKTLDLSIPIVAGESENHSKPHFVLIVQELENPYLLELFEGAKNAAELNDVTIELKGTKQTNLDDHMKLIEMAIASKVDGILTQGLSNEFEPVFQKAIDKGIPLILVDSNLENNDFVTYIGTDNYEAGYRMGLMISSEIQEETKVGVLTGSLIPNNLNERVQGFLDAIEVDKRIKVVAIESSNLSKIQGAEKTYQMLRNDPDISILYGTSALDSQGIAEGIRKANLEGEISVYAFDALEDTIELLKKGDIDLLMKQEPYLMGQTGVNLLIDVMNGQKIKKEYHIPPTLLRKVDVEDEFK